MKRFEREKDASGRMMERDYRIIEHVFRARYLTGRMVGRLEFKDPQASRCRVRMRKLYDWGYVRKRKVFEVEQDIYYLGLKGRRYIASLGEYPEATVEKIAGVAGDAPAPGLMMNHELTLSRLYMQAVLECRQRQWRLQWKNARMLELEGLGVQPDAYLCVQGSQTAQEAFIEFTAVMPTKKELTDRLAAYGRLWEARNKGIPILWFTTSRAKAQLLWDASKTFVYRDYVYVGLSEEQAGFLTRRMWQWSEAAEAAAWITAGEQVLFKSTAG